MTSAKRAARLIKIKPAQVVAGPPDTLVELLKSAVIKLDTVRFVCVAWADELLAQGATAGLETVMTEAPKDSGRTIVTAEITPAIEELLERYARRARRVSAPIAETDAADPRAVRHGVRALAFGVAPSPARRNRSAVGAGFRSRRREPNRSHGPPRCAWLLG